MSNSHELQLKIGKLLCVDRCTGELTDESLAECLALLDADQIPQGTYHDILEVGLKLARMIEDDNLVTHHVTIRDRRFHPEQLHAVAPCRVIIRCEGSPKSDGHCLEVYRDYPEERVAESATLRGGHQFACNLLDAGQYRITDQVYGFMTATIDVALPGAPTSAAVAAADTAAAGAVDASTKPQPTTAAAIAAASRDAASQQQTVGDLEAAVAAAAACKASDASGQPPDAGPLLSDQVQLQVEGSSSNSSWLAAEGSTSALTASYRPSEEGTLQLLHSSAAGTAEEGEPAPRLATSIEQPAPAAAAVRQPQRFACGLGDLVFDPDPSTLQQSAVASSGLRQAAGTGGGDSRTVTPSPGWDSNQRSRWSRQLSGDAASTTSEESGVVVHSQQPTGGSALYGMGGAFAGGAAGGGVEDGSEAVCRTGSPCSRGVTSSDGEGGDYMHEYEPLASDDGEGGSGMAGSRSSRSSPGPAAWGQGLGGAGTPSSPTPSPTFTPGSTSPRQTRGRLRGHRSSTPRSGSGWAASSRRHGCRLGVGAGGQQAVTSGEDTPEGSPRVVGHMGCVPMEVDAHPPSSSWQEACTQTRPNILGGRSTLAPNTSSSSPARAAGVRPAGLLQRMHLQHQHQQGTQTEEAGAPARRAGALAPGKHVISSKQGPPAPGQLSYQSKQSVVTEELLQQEQPQRPRPRSAWQLQVQQQHQDAALGDVEVQLSSDERLAPGGGSTARSSSPVFTSSSCCLHMQDLTEEGDGRNPEDRIRLPTRLAPLQHSAYGQQGERPGATQWQGGGLMKGESSRSDEGRDAAAPAQQRRQVSISAASTTMCAYEGSLHGSNTSSSGSPTRAALAARGLAMSGTAAADGSSALVAGSREGKGSAKISPRSRMKHQAALQAHLERPASEEDLPGGIPEVKCPRCKKAYYSTFNLWRCKHIHATSQGGSRHKVHHEEVKAFLRALSPAQQAALLDVSRRPEAILLLHAARRHQQDADVLRDRRRQECMETLCRRTDLLLPLVQGWEAAQREHLQWPTVEEIMRLLEDASEGAFMDPHITGCSVEVQQEGHGADPSSGGSGGTGGSNIWRYNACNLANPINLAAGIAFLMEHSIANARYKARAEESARIAQELLQIEAAAAAASSKSTKKRKGPAAPPLTASSAAAQEAAPSPDEDGAAATKQAATHDSAGSGGPAGSLPEEEHISNAGSEGKLGAAGLSPAASAAEVDQAAHYKEQHPSKHVRQGSAGSTGSDPRDGGGRGGRQAGRDQQQQQQQQQGRHPIAPAVAAVQQGKLSAPSSSRASSRRSSFASTTSNASDPDTPTAAAAGAVGASGGGAGDAAGKGARGASRLRSNSSSMVAAPEVGDSSHKQGGGAQGPMHTATGVGPVRGAGEAAGPGKASGKDVKSAPRVAAHQQPPQQQHKGSVQEQGNPQQRQQTRQKPAAQAPMAQPAAAASSQSASNKLRPHTSSAGAGAGHGPGSKPGAAVGTQPAKQQQQQPREAVSSGVAGPAVGSSAKLVKPPAAAPASSSKAAASAGAKAGAASSGPPGLGGHQPSQQLKQQGQGHAPAPAPSRPPAVAGAGAAPIIRTFAAAAAKGSQQQPQEAGQAPSQVPAEPEHSAAVAAEGSSAVDKPQQQQQQQEAAQSLEAQPPQQQPGYPMGPGAGGAGAPAMHPAEIHHQQMMMQQYYMDMYMQQQWHMQQQQQQHMQQQQAAGPAGTAAASNQQQQQQGAAAAGSRAQQQRPPPISCGSPALGGSDAGGSTGGTPAGAGSQALSPQQQQSQQEYQAPAAGGYPYQGHPSGVPPEFSRYPMAAAHQPWAPPGTWGPPAGPPSEPPSGQQQRGSPAMAAEGPGAQVPTQEGSTAASGGPSGAQNQHPGADAAAWQAHQQHMAWLWQQHHMQQMYQQHMQAQAAAAAQQQQLQQAAVASATAPAAAAGQGTSDQTQVVALRFGDVPDVLFSDGDSETPGSRAAATPPAAGDVQPALSSQQQVSAAPPGPSRLLLLLQQALGLEGLQQAQRIAAAALAAAGDGAYVDATPALTHNAAAAATELEARWAAAAAATAAAAPRTAGQQLLQHLMPVGGSYRSSTSKGGGGVAMAAGGMSTHSQPASTPVHSWSGSRQPPAATNHHAATSSQPAEAGDTRRAASSSSSRSSQQDGPSMVGGSTSTTAVPGGEWHVAASWTAQSAADRDTWTTKASTTATRSSGQQHRPAAPAWSSAAARDKAGPAGAGAAASGAGTTRVAAAGRPGSAPASPKQWPPLGAAGQGQAKGHGGRGRRH